MSECQLRLMEPADWTAVSQLIFDSTNHWYARRGMGPVFQNGPESTRLFCEVYETLDPGCCVVAVVETSNQIVGSCFFHPRETHVSLGIMNVDPNCFGQHVASRMLDYVVQLANQKSLPIRLVSSAMNLDSYSLYNRAGFVPRATFQDMFLQVPENGLGWEPHLRRFVRPAIEEDVEQMVRLELELNHINREQDFRYFINNDMGIWRTSVLENQIGGLDGFLVSVNHPGSHMLGPGVSRNWEIAGALLAHELDACRGQSPVFLVPVEQCELIRQLYDHGGRNCELHFAQVRGDWKPADGIVMPTFMPETG